MVQLETLSSTFHLLNDGHHIPALGLGTYQVPDGPVAVAAFLRAIEVGYRHFDSAALYGNEYSVGEAIRASGLPRSDFFVTTKLWNSDHGYDQTMRAFERSLTLLNLDYIDLYLIHWPVPHKRTSSWRAMVEIQQSDPCRSIGVSNYMTHHLEEILEMGTVVPSINQIELHPFNFGARKEVIAFCARHGICIEAYSPLTKARRLTEPALTNIASIYGKSPAQILIRWGMQKGFAVIPKSIDETRMRENADVFNFEIAPDHMGTLDALNENWSTSWDPTDAP